MGKMQIGKFREDIGMGQSELANRLKVDRTTVVKWETGNALPRTSMLPKLAKVLRCSIDDLFSRKVE